MLNQPSENIILPDAEKANLEKARELVTNTEAEALRLRQDVNVSKDKVEMLKKEEAVLSESLGRINNQISASLKREQVLNSEIASKQELLLNSQKQFDALTESILSSEKELELLGQKLSAIKQKISDNELWLSEAWEKINSENADIAKKREALSNVVALLQ